MVHGERFAAIEFAAMSAERATVFSADFDAFSGRSKNFCHCVSSKSFAVGRLPERRPIEIAQHRMRIRVNGARAGQLGSRPATGFNGDDCNVRPPCGLHVVRCVT
jgi:hypothetical protein